MLSTLEKIRYFLFLAACFLLTQVASPVVSEPKSIANEAVILSDRFENNPETGEYIFSGDVEIYFEGMQLNAKQITYDFSTEMVEILGPFQLIEADGVSTTYGEYAELSSNLETGVLSAVKRVIDDALRIEAAEVNREAGQYSQFKAIRASTCNVCIESQEPLWELIASEAYHDNVEKHVTYRQARLLIRGFPVAYLPWIRVPDPTVKRADGFLAPSFKFNSELGNQVSLPYFKALGNTADLTIAPHLPLSGFNASRNQSKTVEAKYRHIFETGHLELNGALSSDDFKINTRSYLFSNGAFKLRNDYQLKFQTQSASDKSYLSTYRFHSSPRETFTGEQIQFIPDRLSTKLFLRPIANQNGLHIEYDYFSPLLGQGGSYETANNKFNLRYTDDLELEQLPGNVKLSSGIQLYHNDLGALNVNKRDISRSSINLFWNDGHQHEQFNTYYEVGTFIDNYIISDDPSYNGSKSGLGYYYSGKIERPLLVPLGETHALNFKPSIALNSYDVAKYNIPAVADSDIDLIDPYNAGNLARFHRFDRRQNHGDAITSLMFALPIEQKLPREMFLQTNMEKDVIIYSQSEKLIEDAVLYSASVGRNGDGLNFTILNKYDEQLTNIYNDTTFRFPFKLGSSYAGYRYRATNQVFQSVEAVEDWYLGVSVNPTDTLTLDLSTRLDEIDPTQSHSDLFINYGDVSNFQGQLNLRYNRYRDNIEERAINLSKTVLGDGKIYFKYTDKFEISETVGIGLSYHNECMQFDLVLDQYTDETADKRLINELTFMVKLGSFGNTGTSSCS